MSQLYTGTKLLSLILLITLMGGTNSLTAKPNKKKQNCKTEIQPNYDTVFPQDKVNRIDLVIKPEDWIKMMNELKNKFGEPGKNRMGGGHPPFHGGADSSFRPPFPGDENDSLHRKEIGNFQGMPSGARPEGMPPLEEESDSLHRGMRPPLGFGGPMGKDFTPEYVPCSLSFNGKIWENVRFRLKGNSSLMGTWSRNIKKFPFRLEFDKSNDSVPHKNNSNFWGFRKLSFSNNTNDMSFMREKIANEIFREAGVKSPHAAFYQVYINYGEGSTYFGLYTAIEIVEDTMLKDLFGDDSGNCYKPEGKSASFCGTFDAESFEKKNNKKAGNWTDIEKLFNILNSDLRKKEPSKWCEQLESIFDVPAFINWLAVNTTIQNWDTYGQMAHNYYLYNNPASQKLVWIPWDNNEALSGNRENSSSFSLAKISKNWPLIRYLMDQPQYSALYRSDIKSLIATTFEPERMKKKYLMYQKLISQYIIGENGEKKGFTFLSSPDDFTKAIEQLNKHVDIRNQLAHQFIEE